MRLWREEADCPGGLHGMHRQHVTAACRGSMPCSHHHGDGTVPSREGDGTVPSREQRAESREQRTEGAPPRPHPPHQFSAASGRKVRRDAPKAGAGARRQPAARPSAAPRYSD
eukprot:gene15342-23427_t